MSCGTLNGGMSVWDPERRRAVGTIEPKGAVSAPPEDDVLPVGQEGETEQDHPEPEEHYHQCLGCGKGSGDPCYREHKNPSGFCGRCCGDEF